MITGLKLIGGPLDGATFDIGGDEPPKTRSGNLEFGGLTYWLDLDKGTATFVKGTMDKKTQLLMRTIHG